jgi:hypothetical protein
MKTLTTLIAVVATSFAINVNAGSVHNDPGIGDAFPIQDVTYQKSSGSASNPNEMVWNSNSEGYILNSTEQNTVASALRELQSNPPAAGRSNSREVFIYNDNAGEYQLQ